MDCSEFQGALSRFLDSELEDPSRQAAFRAHRDSCRACRDTLEAHQGLERLMADVPVLSPPAVTPTPLRAPISPPPRSAPWFTTLRACAAVVAVVTLFLVGRGQAPGAGGSVASATPPASTVPVADTTSAVRSREMRVGESTYRVTVEGEGTQLLSCRVEEGPGQSMEVDCTRDADPERVP